MAFPDVSAGQSVGLGAVLERSEVTAALKYAEKHWHEWALPPAGDDAADTKSSQ